ncbi:MAG: hypothetical protein OT477_07335, partial [Chloroflexi bacterium]|nr:hypothetical protein [Chloroflexota bacterium]
EPIKIGTIPACWYDEVMWVPDETKVIIPRGVDIRRCGDYSGWVLDLNQKHLIPVVAYDTYGGEAILYNVSPSGEYFSFSGYINNQNQERLFVFDLNTLIAQELNAPGFLGVEDWISGNHILVDYMDDSGFLGPSIFDLSSNRVIPLASSIANPEYCERRYAVSPDKNWLAFKVTIGGCHYGQSAERVDELWLIDISGFK